MHSTLNTSVPNIGMVISKITNAYIIQTNTDRLQCTLATRLKKEVNSDPVTVGDHVLWNEANQITDVLPRRNRLARRASQAAHGGYAREQVIAANLDWVIPVFAAANPRPAWNLLDRYLVSAESSDIPALACITKMDLVDGTLEAKEIETVAAEYRAIGYEVILTSTVTKRGLDELKAALNGRVSAFVGKSGVGKTSLLNALLPGLQERVQATSKATGKGKHTTSHAEMFSLGEGGYLMDTPGVREFGLWEVEQDDLALYFPEMRPLVGSCKFGLGCGHDQEPGCSIRKAVVAGQISPYRYQSYLKLRVQP